MNRQLRNKPLTVYKASAGSGKTFTLATEYIKLLITNPSDFKNVLAVTFTNKATEEMKIRILSQLYGIWKQLEESYSYTNAICSDLELSADYVSDQAGIALQLLLHNYSNFRIETIDSFFQSVLRNLARELDLTANLHIELNDSQVADMAVDELIGNLHGNDKLLHWIIRYINDNISEDKSWNVIGSIKVFGKTIFKDFYKEARDSFADVFMQNDFFEQYIAQLMAIKKMASNEMQGYSADFFNIIAHEGLSMNDFAYGQSGVCSFFVKLQNGIFDEKIVGKRVTDCLENPEKWAAKKSHSYNLVCKLAAERLVPLLERAVAERGKQWCLFKSADITLRHLNQLRLLNSIENKVNELNTNANRFLLSDTQYLLMSLIGDNDTPFVYEKIGAHLKYIMIDEFQDTSTIQWHNFKVLLQDCMSHESAKNIIVGDVKQSIYRWRDSDWRLLNAIGEQFFNSEKQVQVCSLSTNYRSQRNVVLFNNSLFSHAAEIEYNNQASLAKESAIQLKNAYADVKQEIPSTRNAAGYVSVELLPSDNYVEETLSALGKYVRLLLQQGVSPNEIAILVRTNNNIPVIANYFTENYPEVKIVSDEAFRLDSSIAVNAIVHAVHLLTHRDDRISATFLAKLYQNYIIESGFSDEDFPNSEILQLLPTEYVCNMDRLRTTPLYDLAEQIFQIFSLERFSDQSAYVCAFFDQLSKFTEDYLPDIDLFVERWNESIRNVTIQSGSIDGIRLISIHKSKGLEFNSVLVPFCDWQLEKTTGNILWCVPSAPPFNELPLVPVDFSSVLMGTVYEADYIEEKLQNCVDNLNLLYVAFTRAESNLFVIGKRDAKNSRSSLLQMCLPAVASELEGAMLDGQENKDASIRFTYGNIYVNGKTSKEATSNPFLTPSVLKPLKVKTFSSKIEFKQSNKSRDFLSNVDDDQQSKYINTGSVLHKVLSSVSTISDVDKSIRQLETEGILSAGDIPLSDVAQLLHKRLEDPRVRDWFSGKWTVFNERSILYTDESGNTIERRPDRVMTDGRQVIVVDFKFGKSRPEHQQQVRQYMSLLMQMGHSHIKGYLWYVYDNNIEEV